MTKEKIFSLIRELFAPVALILLGALLLFNPDSASALISKLNSYPGRSRPGYFHAVTAVDFARIYCLFPRYGI